jgi:RimJ/RimL family protein N-acetyltransferase
MILAAGITILLRDRLSADVENFVYWQTHGEWRFYDAPWEGIQESLTADQEAKMRQKYLEKCAADLPSPRTSATIANRDNRPLGWVTHYTQERFSDAWFVGIDICEDACLGHGLGTEALVLWMDYLFGNSSVHRIGLDTWSLNPRMIHVAGKAGLIYEGAQREILLWQERRLDFVHFGITRKEWNTRKEIT